MFKNMLSLRTVPRLSRKMSSVASYDDMMKVKSEHFHPTQIPYYKKPVYVTSGSMQYLTDSNGKQYLDMFGGIVTVSVGHCHPHVVAALKEQSTKLWHTTNIYVHPQLVKYTEKLLSKFPDPLKTVYFVNSGSDANDIAMIMARLYTGNFDVLAVRGAYHGLSLSTMGLSCLPNWNHSLPKRFGIFHSANPDPYRGLFGGSNCRDSPSQVINRDCSCKPGECKANDKYIRELDDTITFAACKNVAAMYLESIQGVNGTTQFTKGFVRQAFEKIRHYNGLAVSDEVQTGFGRLGSHFWGFQSHDAVPDIVTLAKGIGNGFPMAAVITRREIAQSMTGSNYFHTYSGNPLACAVGNAVLEVIEEENLQENCAKVGTHFINELKQLQREFDVIGDVRGKGLMLGLELVKSKETNEPMGAEQFGKLFEDLKDLGVLVGRGGAYSNVFRFKPPMCITKENASHAVDAIRTALKNNGY